MRFGEKREAIAQPMPDGFLRRGNYLVYLPLSREGKLLGYMQIAMHSDRIAQISNPPSWPSIGLVGGPIV